jgi:4-diphosphocytidyl-2C-methyl-D-erythritol kinase
VTPALAVATGDVFAVFSAGGRGSGSTRLASEHLAQELRTGLSGADLVVRSGVLASANDLAAATAAVVPALVPFRRALMRRLGRPVGQSGSGPTLWALYPSRDEARAAADDLVDGLRSGSLVAPGGAAPFVHATTLAFSQESRP